MRKNLYGACMDCGSAAEHIMVDEAPPMYREEIVHYTCGAVLRSMSAARGKKSSVSHEGCTAGDNNCDAASSMEHLKPTPLVT